MRNVAETTREFVDWLDDYRNSGIGNQIALDIEDFYFPSGDLANRGVPEYTGSSANVYAGLNPNAYSNSEPKDMGGDKLYADLIRAQTKDYMTRYAPVENFLASEITNTGTKSLAGDLTRTREAVVNSAGNVGGQQLRGMERYGLTKAPSSQNNMTTASTLVGGLNATRAADSDRRTQLLTGSLSGISQKAAAIGV
jgi:hypothetical protein